MKLIRSLGAAGLVLLLSAGLAAAQTPPPVGIKGQAYGSKASLLGTDVPPLRTSDTGPQMATAPGSIDKTAPAQPVAEIPGAVRVVTSSASRTFGNAYLDGDQVNRCDSFVVSTAGVDPAGTGSCTSANQTRNAVVDVIPGNPSLLRAVTTCSEVSISGKANPAGKSFVSALEINGTPIAPLTSNTKTVYISESLPLIRLNNQVVQTSINPVTGLGSASITQEALRVQAIDDTGQVVQVILTSASGGLSDVPQDCPIFNCPIPNVDPDATFAVDRVCPKSPDKDDEIDFEIKARNDGQGDASFRLVSRVPTNVSVAASSIQVPAGATATLAKCPANLSFAGCAGEAATDANRDCITVDAPLLKGGNSLTLEFRGKVTTSGTVCATSIATLTPLSPLCNRPPLSKEAALVIPKGNCQGPPPTAKPTATPKGGGGGPRPTRTPGPSTTPPGSDSPGLGSQPLHTTGSGGCSVAAGSSSFDVWPLFLLALLAFRRRRK